MVADERRRSRRGLLVGLAAVVVVALVAGGWWFLLRDTAEPPATVDCESTGDESGPGSLEGTWSVTPSEDVFGGYRIEEVFGGDTFKRTVTGRSSEVAGELVIEGDRIETAAVEVDTRALTTDQARRDRWLESNALQTELFPLASFELTEPVPLPPDPEPGEGLEVDLVGDLTLHGVTRAVEIPVEGCWNPPGIDVAGSLPVELADYDIEPPDVPGLAKVDPDGTLELQLTFEPAGG